MVVTWILLFVVLFFCDDTYWSGLALLVAAFTCFLGALWICARHQV